MAHAAGTLHRVLLIDELRHEHDCIDDMLGALRTYARLRVEARAGGDDAARFLAFFRLYADQFHHAREEDVLFPALVRELELPLSRGPIAVLTSDHGRMRALFAELSSLLGAPLPDAATAQRLERVVVAYSRALWVHIDVENSVLFPEAVARLLRVGVQDLPSRPPNGDEARAREDAVGLLLRYPRTIDAQVMRGDGCVICPSYGAGCDGLEREWWSENEWEEFPDRFA